MLPTLRKERALKKVISHTTSTKGAELLTADQSPLALLEQTPDPSDFVNILRFACTQYDIEVYLDFEVRYEEWKTGGRDKKRQSSKSNLVSTSTVIGQARTSDIRRYSNYSSISSTNKLPPLKVILTYNFNDKLQRIEIKETVPKEIVNVIGIIANYHPLLFSFLLKGQQDQYVIYEVGKLLPLSNITEIIFDSVDNDYGNFYVVLDNPGVLTCLTITRCNVNDVIVKEIVERLMYGTPGGNVVKYLNLSCNFITDTGALFIGELLRTNITLYYINLASNQITDAGTACILDSLKQFEITRDESECASKLYTEYLKEKYIVLKQFMDEVKIEKNKKSKSTLKLKRRKTSKASHDDVQLMQQAEQALKYPAFDHPYQHSRKINKENLIYCIGNTTLTGLNLAYNSLTHTSMTKILEVIKYKMALEDPRYRGMVRICVEGNLLIGSSKDLRMIDTYLMENLSRHGKAAMPKPRSNSIA